MIDYILIAIVFLSVFGFFILLERVLDGMESDKGVNNPGKDRNHPDEGSKDQCVKSKESETGIPAETKK